MSVPLRHKNLLERTQWCCSVKCYSVNIVFSCSITPFNWIDWFAYSVAENQPCSVLWPQESVQDHHIVHKQELMSDHVAYSPTPTKVSHKQHNVGRSLQHSKKRLYRLFTFNRQNVLHNCLSWPFFGSVISKGTLSRALLPHTIERSLGEEGERGQSHRTAAAIHLQLKWNKQKSTQIFYSQVTPFDLNK